MKAQRIRKTLWFASLLLGAGVAGIGALVVVQKPAEAKEPIAKAKKVMEDYRKRTPTQVLQPAEALRLEPMLNPGLKVAVRVPDATMDAMRMPLRFFATRLEVVPDHRRDRLVGKACLLQPHHAFDVAVIAFDHEADHVLAQARRFQPGQFVRRQRAERRARTCRSRCPCTAVVPAA